MSPGNVRRYTQIKSHQSDYIKMSVTRTIDILTYMGAKPRRTECYRENLRQLKKAESGRNGLFQGKPHQFLIEN